MIGNESKEFGIQIYVKAENTRDFSRGMNRLIFLKSDTKIIANRSYSYTLGNSTSIEDRKIAGDNEVVCTANRRDCGDSLLRN